LYGAAALGGSVNVETSPFGDAPHLSASAASGSFGTRRVVFEGASGPLDSGWSLYGRYARIGTDGYPDPSRARLWSYVPRARAGRGGGGVPRAGGPAGGGGNRRAGRPCRAAGGSPPPPPPPPPRSTGPPSPRAACPATAATTRSRTTASAITSSSRITS